VNGSLQEVHRPFDYETATGGFGSKLVLASGYEAATRNQTLKRLRVVEVAIASVKGWPGYRSTPKKADGPNFADRPNPATQPTNGSFF
jgi:hypothetical protein